MPSYVRAGIRKCARIRALSGGLCDRLFGDLSAKKLRKVLFGAVAAVVIVIEQYVRNVLGDDAKNWTIEFKDVQ